MLSLAVTCRIALQMAVLAGVLMTLSGCGPNERVSATQSALEPALAMAEPRSDFAAVRLDDGRVLVCGGREYIGCDLPDSPDCYLYSNTCEFFDPGLRRWSSAGEMPYARARHTLTLLDSNTILVAGGSQSDTAGVDTAVVGTLADSGVVGGGIQWHGLGLNELSLERYGHSANLLANGNVLLVGGTDGVDAVPPELWSGAGMVQLQVPTELCLERIYHAAVALQAVPQGVFGGESPILITGGWSYNCMTSTLPSGSLPSAIYLGSRWRTAPALPDNRAGHSATLLSDGSILIAGGCPESDPCTAWRYSYADSPTDPTQGHWSPAGETTTRRNHQAARFGEYVLIAGGEGSNGVAMTSVEVYNPFANAASERDDHRWVSLKPLEIARANFALVPLNGGRALAIGGNDNTSTWSSSEELAPFPLGHACTPGTSNQCVSGVCRDGICCQTDCNGTCEFCNSEGKCTPVDGAPPRAPRPSCPQGFLCANGACAMSCSEQSPCATGYFCAAYQCLPLKGKGVLCAASTECQSGLSCSDRVCCESSCDGQCEHCTASGDCEASVEPRPARPCDASLGDSGCAPHCDGKTRDRCVFPLGQSCAASVCDGANLLSARQCDEGGVCLAAAAQSCAGYLCDASGPLPECRSACGADDECAENHRCEGGRCILKFARGGRCSAARECQDSLNCVDGVCCNTTCEGQCERCNEAGECVASKTPRSGQPCDDHFEDAACAPRCDGVQRDKCTFPEGPCAASTCDGDFLLKERRCDGAGVCLSALLVSCQKYGCDASVPACLTACRSATDCAADHTCEDGKCVSDEDRCDDSRLTSSRPNQEPTDCFPYYCDEKMGRRCAAECTVTGDCRAGFSCENSTCTALAGATSAERSGCACTMRSNSSSRFAVIGSALFALVSARLRRRRARLKA